MKAVQTWWMFAILLACAIGYASVWVSAAPEKPRKLYRISMVMPMTPPRVWKGYELETVLGGGLKFKAAGTGLPTQVMFAPLIVEELDP